MSSLEDIAKGKSDILRPYNSEIDTILYYGLIAPYLRNYLRGRELATKIWLFKGSLKAIVKRGSSEEPLYIDDLASSVTSDLLAAREKYGELHTARPYITDKQELAWKYFVPRRLIGFHYATNREGEGREITRVFLDLDRGYGISASDALDAAIALVSVMQSDDKYDQYFKREPFIAWTGSSFHVMLTLRSTQPAGFYSFHLEASGGSNVSMVEQCADQVNGRVQFKVVAGDGVSLPLTADMLHRDLLPGLESYTPEKIIEDIRELAARLPS